MMDRCMGQPGSPLRSRGRARRPGRCAALLLALAPAALLAASPASSAPAEGKGRAAGVPSDPEAVARVNGHPILRREFDFAVQMQFRGRRNPVGLRELQETRDAVLELLIDQELLYQKASKSEASVSDKEVEAEFEATKRRFPSAADFATELRRSGVSEDEFKAQLRRTLVVTRFVEREIVGEVKVSDEEVRRDYDQNPKELNRPEAVHLAQILVRVAPDASQEARAAARLKIEEILKEARAGGAFADLARRYSEGPEATREGDTGWVARGQAPPAIEHAAFALEVGQMSDVVESRLGFHILRVLEKRPEGPIPFEEAKSAIRARLVARGRDEKLRPYVEQLKEKARIERSLKAAS
jgi:peptidyl-prolyl cis-trans isomerase C